MNYAYDVHGKLIYLTTVAQAKTWQQAQRIFYCPDCGAMLKIQLGPKQKPHFKHMTRHKVKNQESALHRLGKIQLAQGLEALGVAHKIEATSKDKTRRADVAVSYQGQKLALEWQCAQISPTQIYHRTRSYQQQSIQVQWLLGPKYRFKGRLRACQRSFLNYHTALGFFLVFYDVTTQRLTMVHHIRQLELTTRVQYQQVILPLQQGLELLLHPEMATFTPGSAADHRSIDTKRQSIAHKLLRREPRAQQCQQQCYQQGHNLQCLPSSCFEPVGLPPLYPQVDCFLNGQLLLQLETRQSWTYAQIEGLYRGLLPTATTILATDAWLTWTLSKVLQRFYGQKILQYVSQRFIVDHKRLQAW